MVWRFVVCDLQGRGLAILPRTRARKISVRLNQPTSVEGDNSSWDESIASIHSDGYPYLDAADRTLKCFRLEKRPDGSTLWKQRFAGHVYTVTDAGDESDATSHFLAYSPLQRLASRKARDAAGSDALVIYTTVDGGAILKEQVDRTQTFKGAAGIDTAGGIWDPCPALSARWERKFIAEGATELTGSSPGFDLVETPVDRTNGQLVTLGATPRRGGFRPNVKLGYWAAPHNIAKLTATYDGTKLANDIAGMGQTQSGASTLISPQTDAPSAGRYGVYEDVFTAPDSADQATLDSLTISELGQRRGIPGDLKIDLHPGFVPPWIDGDGNATWDVGDSFQIVAGSKFRGGLVQNVRVQGFDLAIDEEGGETVTTLYAVSAAL